MTKIMTLAFLILTALVLFPKEAFSVGDPPPIELVECGAGEFDSGTFVTVGGYCTSNSGGCSQGNKDRARQDANDNFNNNVTNGHDCKKCTTSDEPPVEIQCIEEFNVTPTGGYTDANCVCSTGGACEGNPFKTQIWMTCTASLSWIYDCSDPCAGEL